jgi:hypothetical protein
MNWRKQKRMNMEMANANLLKETHEHSDEGKIEYIQGALKNLTSEDLDKVYLMVEELDPEYGEDDLTRLGRKINQGKASPPFWGF